MSRNFDGTDDVVSTANSSTLDIPALTWCLWVRPDTLGESSAGTFFRKVDSAGTGKHIFRINGTSADVTFFMTWAGNDLTRNSAISLVTLGVWQHWAVTWNGSATASEVKIYKNGVEVTYGTTSNASSTVESTDGGAITIGGTLAGTLSFDGRIAHPEQYNRALSVEEIRQTMRFPGSVRRGLSVQLPFWGGTPEPDYSGNGNSGIVSGATVSSDNPPISGVFTVPNPELINVF